jgi:hypothetical protein
MDTPVSHETLDFLRTILEQNHPLLATYHKSHLQQRICEQDDFPVRGVPELADQLNLWCYPVWGQRNLAYYTDENGKGTCMVNATEEQFRCMTTHGKMSLEDMARRIGICDVFCYPRVPKEFTTPRKVCKPDNARLFQAWVEEEVQELKKRRDAIVWNSPPIFLACAGNTAKYNSCYTDPVRTTLFKLVLYIKTYTNTLLHKGQGADAASQCHYRPPLRVDPLACRPPRAPPHIRIRPAQGRGERRWLQRHRRAPVPRPRVPQRVLL